MGFAVALTKCLPDLSRLSIAKAPPRAPPVVATGTGATLSEALQQKLGTTGPVYCARVAPSAELLDFGPNVIVDKPAIESVSLLIATQKASEPIYTTLAQNPRFRAMLSMTQLRDTGRFVLTCRYMGKWVFVHKQQTWGDCGLPCTLKPVASAQPIDMVLHYVTTGYTAANKRDVNLRIVHGLYHSRKHVRRLHDARRRDMAALDEAMESMPSAEEVRQWQSQQDDVWSDDEFVDVLKRELEARDARLGLEGASA